MTKYVKNKDESDYNEIEFDIDKVTECNEKYKKIVKNPISVNLSDETIVELKELAIKKGIDHQVLIQMLILEGMERMKRNV